MGKRSAEELNQIDAAKIERRRRMLARAKDKMIGELESLAGQLDDYAVLGQQEGKDMDIIVVAADTLRSWADERAEAAVPSAAPKIGGAQ